MKSNTNSVYLILVKVKNVLTVFNNIVLVKGC